MKLVMLLVLVLLSGCIFIWGGTNIRVNDAHTDSLAAAPGSKSEAGEDTNAKQEP